MIASISYDMAFQNIRVVLCICIINIYSTNANLCMLMSTYNECIANLVL